MKCKVDTARDQMISAVTIGTLGCVLLTLVGAALCATLITTEKIEQSTSGYCVLAIILLSSAIGSAIGAGKACGKRLYICLLVGCVYMATLLATSVLFFGGPNAGVVITAFVIITGSIVAVLLGMNNKKQSNQRRSKNRRR